MSDFSDKRIFGLDMLRAFAILAVLFAHAGALLPRHIEYFYSQFMIDGVSLFFVLSGFLIGGILIKVIENTPFKKKDLLDFWIRRWFRTIPNYVLILSILTIISFFSSEKVDLSRYIKYLTFSQNLFYHHPVFFSEAWSLSVEEWFYLSVPGFIFFSLYFFKGKKNKIIFFWIWIIIIGVTLFRIYRAYKFNYGSIEEWDLNLRKQVITRLDAIMYGFLGSYIIYYFKPNFNFITRSFMFLAGLGIIFSPILYHYLTNANSLFYLRYFHLTFSSLGTLLTIPFLLEMKNGDSFIHQFVTLTSKISYSLYLIHASLILGTIMPFIKLDWHMKVIIFFIASYSISFLLYKYFESPMTKLRENPPFSRGFAGA
jgi:peptidoglycan/LPS O-acetylase OafA/YrhL